MSRLTPILMIRQASSPPGKVELANDGAARADLFVLQYLKTAYDISNNNESSDLKRWPPVAVWQLSFPHHVKANANSNDPPG
jgi:hypothetical protein